MMFDAREWTCILTWYIYTIHITVVIYNFKPLRRSLKNSDKNTLKVIVQTDREVRKIDFKAEISDI